MEKELKNPVWRDSHDIEHNVYWRDGSNNETA